MLDSAGCGFGDLDDNTWMARARSGVDPLNYSLTQSTWHVSELWWAFCWCASVISVMISHCMGARIMVEEMMGSLVCGCMDDSYCWDRASALVFREPGRYVTVKLNLMKNKAHLACLWLGLLVDLRESSSKSFFELLKFRYGYLCSHKTLLPLFKHRGHAWVLQLCWNCEWIVDRS